MNPSSWPSFLQKNLSGAEFAPEHCFKKVIMHFILLVVDKFNTIIIGFECYLIFFSRSLLSPIFCLVCVCIFFICVLCNQDNVTFLVYRDSSTVVIIIRAEVLYVFCTQIIVSVRLVI